MGFDSTKLISVSGFTAGQSRAPEINFVESNPIPVKAAMAEMGLLKPLWRLPLVAPKAENQARVRAVLESLELADRAAGSTSVERVHAAIAS